MSTKEYSNWVLAFPDRCMSFRTTQSYSNVAIRVRLWVLAFPDRTALSFRDRMWKASTQKVLFWDIARKDCSGPEKQVFPDVGKRLAVLFRWSKQKARERERPLETERPRPTKSYRERRETFKWCFSWFQTSFCPGSFRFFLQRLQLEYGQKESHWGPRKTSVLMSTIRILGCLPFPDHNLQFHFACLLFRTDCCSVFPCFSGPLHFSGPISSTFWVLAFPGPLQVFPDHNLQLEYVLGGPDRCRSPDQMSTIRVRFGCLLFRTAVFFLRSFPDRHIYN